MVGDPRSPPPGVLGDTDLTWEDFPKVTLSVNEDDTLADIIDRAAERFGAVAGAADRVRCATSWLAGGDSRCD